MNNYEILKVDGNLYRINITNVGACGLCSRYKDGDCNPRDNKSYKLCTLIRVIYNNDYPIVGMYFKRVPYISLFMSIYLKYHRLYRYE